MWDLGKGRSRKAATEEIAFMNLEQSEVPASKAQNMMIDPRIDHLATYLAKRGREMDRRDFLRVLQSAFEYGVKEGVVREVVVEKKVLVGGELEGTIVEVERRAILLAIIRCKGNKVRAADKLGMGKTTLYKKLRVYGWSGIAISQATALLEAGQ